MSRQRAIALIKYLKNRLSPGKKNFDDARHFAACMGWQVSFGYPAYYTLPDGLRITLSQIYEWSEDYTVADARKVEIKQRALHTQLTV